MAHSQQIINFIKRNDHLFWYTPMEEKQNISEQMLVEFIINFGTLENIKELIQLYGVPKMQKLLLEFKGRKKQNIYPELFHLVYEHLKKVA